MIGPDACPTYERYGEVSDEDRKALIPGDCVEVLRDDRKTTTHHRVKYAPWQLGHGEWVIGLDGIAGGFLLSRVIGKDHEHLPTAKNEIARLRAGLEMMTQILTGGQSTVNWNVKLAKAVLAGADVRSVETVEAIAAGKWRAAQ